MNMKVNKLIGMVVIVTASMLATSCSNEAPFVSSGEGVLNMNTEYRSDIAITTRANEIGGYTEQYLNDNLMVYIENSKGVIRKYKGKNSIPDNITLPVGSYVVEGWTGDSVSASFDKKFFRGYQSGVKIGEGSNTMSLKLDIANVVATVDASALQSVSDLSVKIYHSRGQLEFSSSDIAEAKRGYFMMPNSDTTLKYIVEGTNAAGEKFTKPGEISGVQRAHLYKLVLSTEPVENPGGALIRLVIKDIPIIDESFEILPPPSFKSFYGQYEWNLEDQIVSTAEEKDFQDVKVRALAYETMEELTLSFSDNFTGLEEISGNNLIENLQLQSVLETNGIELQILDTSDKSSIKENPTIDVVEAWIIFNSSFLNDLPVSNDPYLVTMHVKDARGYVKEVVLKIANSENAVETQDPIVSQPASDPEMDPLAVLATSAEVSLYLYADDEEDYGIMYREMGENDYKKVSAKTMTSNIRAASYKEVKVRLTELKSSTTYEYKAYCGDFIEKDNALKSFTTEKKFEIPNSSMELWNTFNSPTVSSAKNVPVPTDGNTVTFWDTGNHGSMSMAGFETILTEASTDMVHSGSKSAKLHSEFVGAFGIGKLGAGNLFIGYFAKRDGTDGILQLGREFNGSHPSSLQLYANYKPGKVQSNGTKGVYLKEGDYDKGQIYVALTTEIVEIRTKSSNQKLFDPEGDEVLAYGQITFEGEYSENGGLKLVDIPLVYKQSAKTTKPQYLIVVCSASKYGDYFEGGQNSTMYVDDFELLYDEIQFDK